MENQKNTIPYETLKNCRFLMFEMGNQVVGYQYLSIKNVKWTPIEKEHLCLEILEFSFDNCEVKVTGTGIKRLLPLIQSDELFLIRVGESIGEKAVRVLEIQCEETENYELG